ncbi:MAG: di-trans,poly-cis-decaprenylcistransferase [Holosporales bacterium]|jgi:undecaprenyl diphosphate synthase|nr:di-trans,poly-cis-decaprenylcistransferase [Holosporales bacterium]
MNNIPKHVAIIPDGNMRWSKKHKCGTVTAYEKGMNVVEQIAVYGNDIGIRYITVFVMSHENLMKRGKAWLDDFFSLVPTIIREFNKKHIVELFKVQTIGDLSRLPISIQTELNELVQKTQSNCGLTLILAIAYSGKEEIVYAANKIIRERTCGSNDNDKPNTLITCEEFSKYMYLNGIPPPDLLIRSANEYRVSGFLLWYLAYAELIFIPELWPDVTVDRFAEVIDCYRKKIRTFGSIRP